MALIMMIIEGELLLAMGRVIGVIEVKHNGGRRLWVTGDEVIDERVGEPVDILAIDAVFKPGKGRGTRQGLRGLQGEPLHAELKQGVVPETIGIIAIRIAGGDLIDTLGEEVTERMMNIGRMALVLHSGGQAFGEANLAVDTTQQEGAKVGRQGPAVKIGPYSIARYGRKT